jgi:hypothetical protein
MLTDTTYPTLTTTTQPDTSLSTVAATALVSTQQWRIAMGKPMQWKAKAAEAEKRWMATPHDETPNNQHGRWGKKAHQPTMNNRNHCDAKTSVDVVKCRGINVQIILENGNL